jgi:hypothetical protein
MLRIQRKDTQRNTAFVRVVASRKWAVHALCRRGDFSYAQMRVEGERSAILVPLHDEEQCHRRSRPCKAYGRTGQREPCPSRNELSHSRRGLLFFF